MRIGWQLYPCQGERHGGEFRILACRVADDIAEAPGRARVGLGSASGRPIASNRLRVSAVSECNVVSKSLLLGKGKSPYPSL